MTRARSLLDFRLDELRQVFERLLPAEVTGLHGDGVRYAFLDDVQFGADHDLSG